MTKHETTHNASNHGLRVLILSSIRAGHRFGLCYIRFGVVISFSGHHRRLPPPETPIPEPPSNPLGPIAPTLTLYLVGDDGKFLRELTTNEFHSDGIFNEFGPYGSKFSSTSIWNEFGRYGSDFSTYSAFNEFASKTPLICYQRRRYPGEAHHEPVHFRGDKPVRDMRGAP
jgi:hypothetical protein